VSPSPVIEHLPSSSISRRRAPSIASHRTSSHVSCFAVHRLPLNIISRLPSFRTEHRLASNIVSCLASSRTEHRLAANIHSHLPSSHTEHRLASNIVSCLASSRAEHQLAADILSYPASTRTKHRLASARIEHPLRSHVVKCRELCDCLPSRSVRRRELRHHRHCLLLRRVLPMYIVSFNINYICAFFLVL
jgi:hypothetical protein